MDVVPRLTPEETKLITNIDPAVPSGGTAAENLLPVRASVLRRLVLGLPLQPLGSPCYGVVGIPVTGLRLSFLEIVNDEKRSDDRAALLDLQDACGPNGEALPPLDLKDCLFRGSILMSRARFRGLSLEGSWFMHLRANGINVEGTLNISHVRSSHDHSHFPTLKQARDSDPRMPTRGAIILPSLPNFSPRVIPHQPLFLTPSQSNSIAPEQQVIRQTDASAHVPWNELPEALSVLASAGHTLGLCWIELRNARVGIDLEATSSILVAPEEHEDLINSPHARHALDIRGAHIRGRFNFAPNHAYVARVPEDVDSADTEPSLNPRKNRPFVAVGGISMVRATVDGSVCGSGAQLIAIEGAAFTAQRASVRSQIFLDYGWEGLSEWVALQAFGFIDLVNATIGSNVYMDGALLYRDRWNRSGVIATQANIGNSLYCCAAPRKDKASKQTVPERSAQFDPFVSAGGISLERAIIHGDLNLNGARLLPNNFGKAIFAPTLTVHGTARMGTSRLEDFPTIALFEARGRIILEGAQFKKDLNWEGARIEHADREHSNALINANHAHVQGYVKLNASPSGRIADPNRPFARTLIRGMVSFQNSYIGMNLDASGALIGGEVDKPSGGIASLDLTGSKIDADLILRGVRQPGSTLPCHCRLQGTLHLRAASVGRFIDLSGTVIKASGNRSAINALSVYVGSRIGIGQGILSDAATDWVPGFTAIGSLDFTNANIQVGLYMLQARVYGKTFSIHPTRPYALIASAAHVPYLDMTRVQLKGHVRLRALSCSDSLKAEHLTIYDGILDVQESELRRLQLTDLRIDGRRKPVAPVLGQVRNRPPKISPWEYKDVLQLSGAQVDTTVTIVFRNSGTAVALPSETAKKTSWIARKYRAAKAAILSVVENTESWTARNYRWAFGKRSSSSHDIQYVVLGGLHATIVDLDVNGLPSQIRLKLDPMKYKVKRSEEKKGTDDPRQSAAAEDSALPNPNSHPPDPGTALAPLRQRNFLQKTADEAPVKSKKNQTRDSSDLYPAAKNYVFMGFWLVGSAAAFLRLDFHLLHSVPPTDVDGLRSAGEIGALLVVLWLVLANILRKLLLSSKSRYLDWLNKQYENPKEPKSAEFDPGVYEEVARMLRDDGQDRPARDVLSAKLSIEARIRPIYEGLVWKLIGFFFDFGLSAGPVLLVLCSCLWIGCLGSYLASEENNLQQIRVFNYQNSSPATVSASVHPPFLPQHDDEYLVLGPGYLAPTSATKCQHADRWVYAIELFIPELKFSDPKQCELSQENTPALANWRALRAAYIGVGWLVTSLTLLAIPGILRRRHEG